MSVSFLGKEVELVIVTIVFMDLDFVQVKQISFLLLFDCSISISADIYCHLLLCDFHITQPSTGEEIKQENKNGNKIVSQRYKDLKFTLRISLFFTF